MLSVGQSHIHRYNNNQRAAMLWYHDHAMHTTRLNVFAGLSSLYLVRDEEEQALNLPTGDYELPLVIQDRNLDDADKIAALITNPCATTAEVNLLHKVEFGEEGPLEFFGPLNLVNGSIWPIKAVEGTCYRVRILNGANSRSYRLLFAEKDDTGYHLCQGINIKQIGTDGGLMPSKNNQLIDLPADGLTLAPAERADLLIDFSNVTGKKIYMLNTANSPFAGSSIAIEDIANIDPDMDENRNPYPEVMCFDVQASCSAQANNFDFKHLAHCMASLPSYTQEAPNFADIAKTRTIAVVEKDTPHGAVLVLWELMLKTALQDNPNHPILNAEREITVDGETFVAVAERFHDPVSMIIPEGSTERWRFINLTADTHPMHVHLVQYLALSRRNILSVNGEDIVNNDDKGDQILTLTAESIASGAAISLAVEAMDDSTDVNMNVDDNEQGLKDTMRVNPGEMIEIMARFEEHCGRFVYHCHLLEHEDHDMMRQFIVTRNDLMGNHMLPISVGS
jgi:spore coat protein A